MQSKVDLNVAQLAVVVIGRNEGERLETCLKSVQFSARHATVVYVDSGSSDNSVQLALGMGCHVVNLDLSLPFTAARARNEGFSKALHLRPDISFVQFVDGDCELAAAWLADGVRFLASDNRFAVVAGRLRERYPERSVYNRLCDYEWNVPAGEAKSCGGIALFRVAPLVSAGGYRQDLIAGEEPELCVRLRAAGWHIWRLRADMALHDANMMKFSQWWVRSRRAGYAFAEGAWLHGAPPERHYFGETRRALVWGGLIPVAAGLGVVWSAYALLLVALYPLQVVRLALRMGPGKPFVWTRAFFMVLAKFPEAFGVMTFYRNKLHGKAGGLIEYK
jgi:glycosyltransferase involved in cell wall biosynthesis